MSSTIQHTTTQHNRARYSSEHFEAEVEVEVRIIDKDLKDIRLDGVVELPCHGGHWTGDKADIDINTVTLTD